MRKFVFIAVLLMTASPVFAGSDMETAPTFDAKLYKKLLILNGSSHYAGNVISNAVAKRLIKLGISVVDFRMGDLIIQQTVDPLAEKDKNAKAEPEKQLGAGENQRSSQLESQYRFSKESLNHAQIDGIVETGFAWKYFYIKLIDVRSGEIEVVAQVEDSGEPNGLADEFTKLFDKNPKKGLFGK